MFYRLIPNSELCFLMRGFPFLQSLCENPRVTWGQGGPRSSSGAQSLPSWCYLLPGALKYMGLCKPRLSHTTSWGYRRPCSCRPTGSMHAGFSGSCPLPILSSVTGRQMCYSVPWLWLSLKEIKLETAHPSVRRPPWASSSQLSLPHGSPSLFNCILLSMLRALTKKVPLFIYLDELGSETWEQIQ